MEFRDHSEPAAGAQQASNVAQYSGRVFGVMQNH